MRYAKIRKEDISNGPGIRVSLFTQGCPIHCPGCFNKETWDPNGGSEFTDKELNDIKKMLEHDYISGLSILGGEPFLWSNEINKLVKDIKQSYPDKDIWIWSGYTLDVLTSSKINSDTLQYVDMLVDGRFDIDQADSSLQYRGSKNQKLYSPAIMKVI